jgi:uncharacterized glyoxalase superfamily protein PhnB
VGAPIGFRCFGRLGWGDDRSPRERRELMKTLTPSLNVADVEASIRFYERVLGFESTGILVGPDGKAVHGGVRRGGVEFMFGTLDWLPEADRDRLGKGVIFYVMVDDETDIDAAFVAAKEAGAAVSHEPTDQFWGCRDWGITDPDGYQIFVAKATRDVSKEEMERSMEQMMLAGAPAD